MPTQSGRQGTGASMTEGLSMTRVEGVIGCEHCRDKTSRLIDGFGHDP